MAHKVFAKDTTSDVCGWADPPCLPVHLSGPTGSIPAANTLEIGSTYWDSQCDTRFELVDDSGNPVWVDVSNSAPAPQQNLTSASYNSNTNQLTYIDELGNATALVVQGTLTSLSWDSVTCELSYIDEAGVTTVLPISRHSHTAAASPPATAKLGDTWWDTANDILYHYINDGAADIWVDQTN